MNKAKAKPKVRISSVIDTKPEPGYGKGMLGFVITYPDGSMHNEVIDYVQEDYSLVLKKINALHRKMISRYRC